MKNPDKWIRKYFYQTLSNMVVNGNSVKVYDTATPNNDNVLIVLSTQSGSDQHNNKCSVDKMRDINIDVITRYKGNVGSRALLDDIIEEILQRTDKIEVENFIVQYYNISYPLDLNQSTSTETIYRKIIKYSLKLTEDGR